MTGYTWRYRCSHCDQLVDVEEVNEHIQAHRREPNWKGMAELTREDITDEPQ